MPRDIALLTKIPASVSESYKSSVGKTDFIFQIFNNDIQFNIARQNVTTEGVNKIIQGILKILLTKPGENIEDLDYGANLENSIGNKMAQENYADLRTNIVNALAHYNLLNMDNENQDEIIGFVDEVKIVRDFKDPRIVLIYIKVTTQSGKKINVTIPQMA